MDVPIIRNAGAAEHDVVEEMHRAGGRLRLVGGGVGHHVAAHAQVQLPSGEDVPQDIEIVGVGQIHRDVVGEDIHIVLVGHGHAHQLTADETGLCLLGPGEFVDGQIHLEAQVTDGLHDALVGQGEGVEGAGEEGCLLRHGEPEGAVLDVVEYDEAVQMAQSGGGVEEGELLLPAAAQQAHDLLGAEGEQGGLVLIAEDGRGEQTLAQNPQGTLLYRTAGCGQTLHQQACQTAAALLQRIGALAEACGVVRIGLQHGANGVQCAADYVGAGGGEESLHLVDDLVQLTGRQPQGEAAQIFGNILGEIGLAGFQRLGKLHSDLVAAVGGHDGCQLQQGLTCHAAHHHMLTDLDEVGEVCGDVQHILIAAAAYLMEQILHTQCLQDPRGGGLQVVQEHGADGGRICQPLLQSRSVQCQLTVQPHLQEQQRRAVLHIGGVYGAGHAAAQLQTHAGGFQQMGEQVQGGGLLGQIADGQPVSGETDQQPAGLRCAVFYGEIHHRVHQGEGCVASRIGMFVVTQQLLQETGRVGLVAFPQHVVHYQLGGIADFTGLHGGKPPVGTDELAQIVSPQLEGKIQLRIGGGVGRQLLLIAGMEVCQNLTDEGGGLTADVAVRIQQLLVEELQRLHLLGRGEIGKVLLEYGDVCTKAAPLLFAVGGFQHAGKQLVVAESMHQADVVLHSTAAQRFHQLIGVHQGRVHVGRGNAGAVQRHIRAQELQILFKVQQLGVDEAVAPCFGGVHVVQLAENHVKGVFERIDLCDLAAVFIPFLLYTEVRVHQNQGLGREVFDLQIPHGVVGGNVADGAQTALGEPLAGIVIVEIGHTLAGAAAKLADIMACGGTADECQIHQAAPGGEGACHRHGDEVDASNVVQRAEGCHLPAQTQHLIDVFLPEAGHELAVLRFHHGAGELLFAAEVKIHQRVEGQLLTLGVQQHLQHLQEAQRGVPLCLGVGDVFPGEHSAARRLVGEGQPAAVGFWGHGLQHGAADLQHRSAGESFLQGQQGTQGGGPVHLPQQAAYLRLADAQHPKKAFFRKRLCQLCGCLPGDVSFHSGLPLRLSAGMLFCSFLTYYYTPNRGRKEEGICKNQGFFRNVWDGCYYHRKFRQKPFFPLAISDKLCYHLLL